MSSRRTLTLVGTALLLVALASPLAAAVCDSACPCPMMAMGATRAAHAGDCASGEAISAAMDCCQRLPAPAVSTASSAVAAAQLLAPLPAEGRDAGHAPASIDAASPVPATPQMARAERRHDLGLQVLNAVFLS